jgi:AAA ATPase domain
LFGREREREVLDRLLDGARGGRGGVLVIHGEAGVGKTALLEYAVEAGPGFRIARTFGVEAMAEAAEQQPLACVVDDAQWLDSASARSLAFVARRLLAEKIALVFATRELGETLAGLPELHVAGLERRAARELLESLLAGRTSAPASVDQSDRGRSSSVGLRRTIGCFLVFCSTTNAIVPHTAGTQSEIAW